MFAMKNFRYAAMLLVRRRINRIVHKTTCTELFRKKKNQHLFLLTTVNLTKDETSDILWEKKNLDPSGGLQKLWCHPLWTMTILTTCHLTWFITVSVFVSVSDWYNTLSILPQNLFWLKMQLKSFELYWNDITVITSQKKIWGLRSLMLFLFYSTYCG